MSILLYPCTAWTLTKRVEKKLDGNYIRILRATKKILEATSYETIAVEPLTSHLKNNQSKTNKTCGRRIDELIAKAFKRTCIHAGRSMLHGIFEAERLPGSAWPPSGGRAASLTPLSPLYSTVPCCPV